MRCTLVRYSLLTVVGLFASHAYALEVAGLRCEFRIDPVIDISQPRLTWRIEDSRRGVAQQAYQIQVASSSSLLDDSKPDLWDSGKVQSGQSHLVPYAGEDLRSRDQCFWRVRVWDHEGVASDWSPSTGWSVGLLEQSDWTAEWIGHDTSELNRNSELDLPPIPLLRKEFRANKPIRRATMYVTALGLYELRINGQRIGDHRLAPGWTDYHRRLYYQTFDVTSLVAKGDNTLATSLGFGWYSGYIGYALLVGLPQYKDFYGTVPGFLCQLEIEYKDGSSEHIVTDDSWKASTGPVLESDLLMGVTYDARMEHADWDRNGFDDTQWKQVEILTPKVGELQAQPHEPIRITEELPAKRVLVAPDGGYILDFGQNFAGTVQLKVVGKPGQKLTIRYGEMLHPDGRLMTENLRKARATDTYVCRGDQEGETWIPRFTYHGFQYAEIRGLAEKPNLDLLTGLVLESDTEPAGDFACSSPLVNRLYKNIVWTQRANFVDVPTDCPQRDERLGWTGDAQIYVRSAAWNRHVPSFFEKWARDCRDAQWPNGAYPNFAPRPYNRDKKPYSPAWMEAGIICPWTMYRVYGDRKILEDNYDSMRRFVEFHIKKAGTDYIYESGSWDELDPAGGWGDWLFLGRETPREVIATLYYGLSLRLMSEVAEVTGHKQDAKLYGDHYRSFLQALLKAYLEPDGKVEGDTQSVYAIVISMGLLPAELEQLAAQRLLALLEATGGTMQTGFLGTKHLPIALTKIGRPDATYDLLTSTRYPSWGYEVVNGATTIWERWNSYTREEGFGAYNAGMNSFCHYSFGSICQWMFEHMAGVQNAEPGFKKIRFEPQLNRLGHISWAEATYDSFYGPIRSRWSLTGDGETAELEFTVPPNTTALTTIPCRDSSEVTEGGKLLSEVEGARMLEQIEGEVSVELGSGIYRFRTVLPPAVQFGTEAL